MSQEFSGSRSTSLDENEPPSHAVEISINFKGKRSISGVCGVQVSCETGQEKAETKFSDEIV